MNDLINKVGGIEKARKIVKAAPKGASYYVNEKSKIVVDLHGFYADGFCVGIHNPHTHFKLDDLRTAIVDHDRTDFCTNFENGLSPNTKVIEK